MQFQIILLPQSDYWAWVRACRDYVLAYGSLLTPELSTAVNYRSPRQIITFPLAGPDAWEPGDLHAWLRSNHPEINLDPIEADSPASFREALAARLKSGDRYGQRQRPFYLLWPTRYPVITQRFGANPQIYGRFGLPGHEGVDIRALPNTDVFACAAGEVYEVQPNPKAHAYGIHVRIRHSQGYRTVYGHLARALVRKGESVSAGQVIGKADSTGASVGAHLHLSLKHDHASERGETNYPKDIIDPTGFLVWPDQSKTLAAHPWPAGRCLIGAHGRLDGAMDEIDLRAIAQARLEAVVVSSNESKETIERLRAQHPGIFLVVRMGGSALPAVMSPERFLRELEPSIGRLHGLGVRYFEIGTNPNLQFEGWGRAWSGGEGFGRWFLEVSGRLKDAFPDAYLGFPGLSPGDSISGQREHALRFVDAAGEAVLAADWLGVSCYWTDLPSMDSLAAGRLYEEYRIQFPDKLLFITEFGNPAPQVKAEEKARQYLDFYREVREQVGIGAAFAFAMSTSQGFHSLVWRTAGEYGPIPALLGKRSF